MERNIKDVRASELLAVQSESQSSIEIKRCTKGTTFTVKVYHVDPDTATKKAIELYNNLNKTYPQVDK